MGVYPALWLDGAGSAATVEVHTMRPDCDDKLPAGWYWGALVDWLNAVCILCVLLSSVFLVLLHAIYT